MESEIDGQRDAEIERWREKRHGEIDKVREREIYKRRKRPER